MEVKTLIKEKLKSKKTEAQALIKVDSSTKKLQSKKKRKCPKVFLHFKLGTGIMAPTSTFQPTTVQTTGVRGRGRRSSSSSSSSSDNRRNIGTGNLGTTGYNQPLNYNQGYSQGYNQGLGTTTTGTYNQPSTLTTGQTQPGFVEKIKYKLRSRHR